MPLARRARRQELEIVNVVNEDGEGSRSSSRKVDLRGSRARALRRARRRPRYLKIRRRRERAPPRSFYDPSAKERRRPSGTRLTLRLRRAIRVLAPHARFYGRFVSNSVKSLLLSVRRTRLGRRFDARTRASRRAGDPRWRRAPGIFDAGGGAELVRRDGEARDDPPISAREGARPRGVSRVHRRGRERARRGMRHPCATFLSELHGGAQPARPSWRDGVPEKRLWEQPDVRRCSVIAPRDGRRDRGGRAPRTTPRLCSALRAVHGDDFEAAAFATLVPGRRRFGRRWAAAYRCATRSHAQRGGDGCRRALGGDDGAARRRRNRALASTRSARDARWRA